MNHDRLYADNHRRWDGMADIALFEAHVKADARRMRDDYLSKLMARAGRKLVTLAQALFGAPPRTRGA